MTCASPAIGSGSSQLWPTAMNNKCWVIKPRRNHANSALRRGKMSEGTFSRYACGPGSGVGGLGMG